MKRLSKTMSILKRDMLRKTDGLAAVELALVLPILSLILVGTWDFGRAFQENARLASAARAGAQYGAYSTDNAEDTNGIILAARYDANDDDEVLLVTPVRSCECPNGSSISCEDTCGSGEMSRMYVTVQVDEEFEPYFEYPFIEAPISLSGQAIMRVR